jgi:hypothetical protein
MGRTVVDIMTDLSGRLKAIPAGAGSTGVSPRGVGSLTATGPLPDGYREVEHLMEGVASTYTGPATGPAAWADGGHRYVTRVVARFPEHPGRFSGRVFLEPFNTTRGGIDTDVAWGQLEPLLRLQGDGWVGVTVRSSAVVALKSFDPVRYGELNLATNDLEWDMLRHLGLIVRQGDAKGLFPDRPVDALYMAGYSQSGVDTATFAMAFHELTSLPDGSPAFDGYLPSAHSGSLSPLRSGDCVVPSFEHAPMSAVAAPVVDLETQTDVEGFTVEVDGRTGYVATGGAHVRRADSVEPGDLYRLYEVAGAPHAPHDPECASCSSFPTDQFVRAAALRLIRWAEEGIVPPEAARIELAVADEVSVAAVDEHGNALGGVRSPFLDLPLSTYGVHADSGGLHMLVGNETILPRGVIVERYGTAESYMIRFAAALDATIEAGFLLALDRAELLAAQEAKASEVFC